MTALAESTLLLLADRLSRASAVFSLDALYGAALSAADTVHDLSDFERAAERLFAKGVLRRSSDSLIRSDRTDRWTDHFAREVSDPTRTNPRVSLYAHREARSDRSHPLDQAQRYTVVDVAKGGGIARVLRSLGERALPTEIIHIHGDRGPDIARFPIGTENLMQAADFVGRASKALHRKDAKRPEFGARTVLIVSGDALRSAHRAMLLATAAAQTGVGKVIILAHPEDPDQFVLTEAVRRGAVSDWRPAFQFSAPVHPRDLSQELQRIEGRVVEVLNETLEQAAAREALNEVTPGRHNAHPMLAYTQARRDNLNKAAQALFVSEDAERRGFPITVMRRVTPHLVDLNTGAGLREGDFLRINRAPPKCAHQVGDIFRIMNVKPVEGTALVKDASNRYVSINFEALRDMHVRLAAYAEQQITINDGERLELERGRQRSLGHAVFVSPSSFAFQPDTGPMVSFTAGSGSPPFLRHGYAGATEPLTNDRLAYAVAGSGDQECDRCFTPGAAAIAGRACEDGRVSDSKIFTDDKAALISHSQSVDLDAAGALDRAYMDAVRNGKPGFSVTAS